MDLQRLIESLMRDPTTEEIISEFINGEIDDDDLDLYGMDLAECKACCVSYDRRDGDIGLCPPCHRMAKKLVEEMRNK